MSKSNNANKKSWWHTLPGVLTAAATVITAVTGLIVGLHQTGWFSEIDGGNHPSTVVNSSKTESVSTDSSSDAGASTRDDGTSGKSQGAVPLAKGMGRLKTSTGSLSFDRITGMSMGQGKLTISQFGAKVDIPLNKIARIFFLHGNSIRIEYRNGKQEDAEFFCYWNTPVRFHSEEKKFYFGGCEDLSGIKEIEFFGPE